MERMKTSRPRSKAAVALRVLALLLLAACAAVFARQVLLCRSALESIPMLLEYPELGETPPLTLEVFQRRVGEKAENSAAWQGELEVELPAGTQKMTARVALSNWGQVAGLAFVEGDFYQPQAVLLRQYQAVVPEGIAAAGQTLSVEGVDYTVCGVYQPEGETAPLYLSAHPDQPNSMLAPNRMLLAQNDRLRLSVLYDLQAKANYTPKAEGGGSGPVEAAAAPGGVRGDPVLHGTALRLCAAAGLSGCGAAVWPMGQHAPRPQAGARLVSGPADFTSGGVEPGLLRSGSAGGVLSDR